MVFITLIGNVGCGKTLLLTILAFYIQSQKPIIANYHLEFDYLKMDLDKFLRHEYEDSCILIDEAYNYFESRISSSKVNLLATYMLMQSRKRNVDLIITTQMNSMIDRRFREMCDLIVLCEDKCEYYEYTFFKSLKMFKILKLFKNNCDFFYNLYDTYEVIESNQSSLNDVAKYTMSLDNKNVQISEYAKEIIKEYEGIKITHDLVKYHFNKHGYYSFLISDTYTEIQLQNLLKSKKEKIDKKSTKKKNP